MIIFGSRTTPDDPIEHYRRQLRELGDVMDSVRCDQRLAIFRAHQHGMSLDDIAHCTHTKVDAAKQVIDELTLEEGIDEWGEPSMWVERRTW